MPVKIRADANTMAAGARSLMMMMVMIMTMVGRRSKADRRPKGRGATRKRGQDGGGAKHAEKDKGIYCVRHQNATSSTRKVT